MWRQFSFLFDGEIAKIAMKFHSDDDAMRANQDRAKKYCLTGWIGSWDFNLFHRQVANRNIVKCCKDILRSLLTLRKGFGMLPLIVLRVAAIGNILPTFPHCTVFREASILSGSGFNEFLVGLSCFHFFSWKRNGLGINPAISRIFLKLSII